jgi:predicted permease
MYKYILDSASNGINWMAIFALVTFVVIFCIGTWLVLRKDQSHIDKMAALPLDDKA